jgi:hypothetical protein
LAASFEASAISCCKSLKMTIIKMKDGYEWRRSTEHHTSFDIRDAS